MAMQSFLDQYRLPAEGDAQKRMGLTQRQNRGVVDANQDNVLAQIRGMIQMNPVILSQLMEYAKMQTPAGMNTRANTYQAGRTASGLETGQNMAARFQAAGVSGSGAAGAIRDQANQATRDSNAYRYQQQDPDQLARIIQILQQGSQVTAAPISATFSNLVHGRPLNTEPKGGGFMDTLSGIVGMGTGLGMDWGKVLSGGGGGGWKGIPYAQ